MIRYLRSAVSCLGGLKPSASVNPADPITDGAKSRKGPLRLAQHSRVSLYHRKQSEGREPAFPSSAHTACTSTTARHSEKARGRALPVPLHLSTPGTLLLLG